MHNFCLVNLRCDNFKITTEIMDQKYCKLCIELVWKFAIYDSLF